MHPAHLVSVRRSTPVPTFMMSALAYSMLERPTPHHAPGVLRLVRLRSIASTRSPVRRCALHASGRAATGPQHVAARSRAVPGIGAGELLRRYHSRHRCRHAELPESRIGHLLRTLAAPAANSSSIASTRAVRLVSPSLSGRATSCRPGHRPGRPRPPGMRSALQCWVAAVRRPTMASRKRRPSCQMAPGGVGGAPPARCEFLSTHSGPYVGVQLVFRLRRRPYRLRKHCGGQRAGESEQIDLIAASRETSGSATALRIMVTKLHLERRGQAPTRSNRAHHPVAGNGGETHRSESSCADSVGQAVVRPGDSILEIRVAADQSGGERGKLARARPRPSSGRGQEIIHPGGTWPMSWAQSRPHRLCTTHLDPRRSPGFASARQAIVSLRVIAACEQQPVRFDRRPPDRA